MSKEQTSITEKLVKTKERIADHGEVFTPRTVVGDMLDLFKNESERIDSRILEQACGEGNFLVQILSRKLATVQYKYRQNEFERYHHGLLALMSSYGIELLEDNVQICRENLMKLFKTFIGPEQPYPWYEAARNVLATNIIQADALTMTDSNGKSIRFPEWSYLGLGKYQRRDFDFGDLTQRSAFSGTLFDSYETDQLFPPRKIYGQLTVNDIAKLQ